VPQLTVKPLYSDGLAKLHLWGTFLFGLANSAIWYVEGLEGGPRRFPELPGRYHSYNTAALPVVILLGATQLLFVWNLAQTVRGKGLERAALATGPARGRPRRRWSDAAAEALLVVAVLGLILAGGFVGWVIGHYGKHGGAKTVAVGASTSSSTSTTTTATTSGGNAGSGRAVFASAGCAGCHTLKAAGATGNVGPNLDERKPPLALVLDRVTNGKGGMPSFKGQLGPAQIRAVASFVAQNAGR
jgi:mono/diheme cytochrome c family protein